MSGGREVLRRTQPELACVVVDGRQLHQDRVRLFEVVAPDLFVLLDSVGRDLLEPVDEPFVKLGPRPLQQAEVRGIPDQDVREPVGLLTGEHRFVGVDQFLSLQTAEAGLDERPGRLADEVLDAAPEEHLSDHGAATDHRALRGGQPVEARGEERQDGGRDRDRALVADGHPGAGFVTAKDALVDQHRDHVLHEQRVALGRFDDPGTQPLVERRPEDVLDDARAFLLGQRRQRDPCCVLLVVDPLDLVVEEIRSRRADDQHGGFDRVQQVREELEEGRLGPVDVVDQHHGWTLARDDLEETARAPERLSHGERRVREADRRRDPLGGVAALLAGQRQELCPRRLEWDRRPRCRPPV